MNDQRGGGISWCDLSWSPTRGCSRLSPGCEHCYAERIAARFSEGHEFLNPNDPTEVEHGPAPFRGFARMTEAGPRWTGRVELVESKLTEPLRRKRSAEKFLAQHGRKPLVFVNSMSDLFHESLFDADRDRIFAVIASADWFTFLSLTKRAGNQSRYFADPQTPFRVQKAVDAITVDSEMREVKHTWRRVVGWQRQVSKIATGRIFKPAALPWPLSHVYLGVSVEDQERADARLPHLIKVAAMGWKTVVSAEPLLGPIDFDGLDCWPQFDHRPTYEYYRTLLKLQGIESNGKSVKEREGVDWLIGGGESGPGARPCEVAWIRSLRDQAKAAGVPTYIKQLGRWPRAQEDVDVRAGKPVHLGGKRIQTQEQMTVPTRPDGFLALRHPRGADPSEWPADVRVQERP